MKIAFDIDGTLERPNNTPNTEVHQLLRQFAELGAEIIVWSGGGEQYARNYVQKHRLPAKYSVKRLDLKPDLAIDDVQLARLGTVNLYVVNDVE